MALMKGSTDGKEGNATIQAKKAESEKKLRHGVYLDIGQTCLAKREKRRQPSGSSVPHNWHETADSACTGMTKR
jgi:hypothetical protein